MPRLEQEQDEPWHVSRTGKRGDLRACVGAGNRAFELWGFGGLASIAGSWRVGIRLWVGRSSIFCQILGFILHLTMGVKARKQGVRKINEIHGTFV